MVRCKDRLFALKSVYVGAGCPLFDRTHCNHALFMRCDVINIIFFCDLMSVRSICALVSKEKDRYAFITFSFCMEFLLT